MITSTDPIADMLTRIRNGQAVGHGFVSVPYSKIKRAIAEILQESGYIAGVKLSQNGAFQSLQLYLSSDQTKATKPISRLKRISKPGRRVYARSSQIPQVLNGKGMMIISTSKGLMTNRQARKAGLGGELICEVW